MTDHDRPTWQLPPGVSRATWDYVNHPDIANNYDEYFAFNTLFEHDERVLLECLHPLGLVADLGCGTGRALLPLVRNGQQGLAIDLSEHMLKIVREKAQLESLPIQCLRANLVELDALSPRSVDHAMCLFSTLGMIRGRENRRRALGHFRRILRPKGRFVLHVHNYWFNLRDPHGPGWLVKNLIAALFSREVEIGDKWFPYRGLPSMFLHVFRWGELASDLQESGFHILQRIPLDVARRDPLKHRWLFQWFRANGWIVVCE